MTYLVVAFATIAFLFSFRLSGIIAVSAKAIEISRRALAVLREPTISDDEKEQAIRGFSIQLFSLFASIAVRSLVLLAVPTALIAGSSVVGLASFHEVTQLLFSWEAIVVISVAFIVLMWLQERWR